MIEDLNSLTLDTGERLQFLRCFLQFLWFLPSSPLKAKVSCSDQQFEAIMVFLASVYCTANMLIAFDFLISTASEMHEALWVGLGIYLRTSSMSSEHRSVVLRTSFISTAKRCSSSQSVPGSRPIRHLGLVVLICSKLCLNAQDWIWQSVEGK